MSEPSLPTESIPPKNTRNERLKEIDALYRSQLKQIYSEEKPKITVTPSSSKIEKIVAKVQVKTNEPALQRVKSSGSLLVKNIQSSKLIGEESKASMFLRGDVSKQLELLRRENQTKQLKIRELNNKCQTLIDRLRQFLPPQDLQNELDNLKDLSSDRSQRLERLFKIKSEEIFFKLKLQVVALLQDFGVTRDELSQSNDIKTQTQLLSFLSKKLKDRLKDFRYREAESTFSLQKDRIVNQKQQERIHFLTETNQLLKLSQNKLKSKVEDLKTQLNQYIDKLKAREQENQERQSQFFMLKRQNEELQLSNQKLSSAVKGAQGQKSEQKRGWEAREKELKLLLNNYNVQKKRLEAEAEEYQGQIEEHLIRMRFIQQQNQRLNRQVLRWKERYEGLEKEKQMRLKQWQEEKHQIIQAFQQYKLNHNDGTDLELKANFQEAMKKVEEYQLAYQEVLEQLEEERRLLQRSQEQNQERLEMSQKEWLARVKKLQKAKEEQVTEIARESEASRLFLQEQYQKKEVLLAQQLQANLRAQLAERDKHNTEQLIKCEAQSDELRRQIQNLNKMLTIKQSLISVLNGKKLSFQ